MLIANIWSTASTYDAQVDRLRRVFDDQLLLLPAGFKTNVLCFGFAGQPKPLDWTGLRAAARQWEAALRLPFGDFVDDLKRLNRHNSRRLLP